MNNKNHLRVFMNPATNKKRGQVTIFIIIAIMIVAITILFFILRERISISKIPSSIEPVYNSFLVCLEDDVETGTGVLRSQGGYIYLPEFEPGSRHMPFSSQLIFLGNPIPYWYYISGNNIQKEQIPSKKNMEEQLAEFIENGIRNCVFDEYYEQGFEIEQGERNARVSIMDEKVEVNLAMDLSIKKGEDSALIREHKIIVNSNLGRLYNSARKIYEKEQKELFLENYTVDILRAYAPVDGVELSCSPKIWSADEVFGTLGEAIEANVLALNTIRNNYFTVKAPIKEGVRFITSKNWPSSFEVAPSEGSILISKPIGNQPGLGVLGFCYVPYHFVYNIKYPVLVQIYSENEQEIFQFPIAVVIQGNKPREALDVSAVSSEAPELCKYKNTLINVKTYDANLNPVEAEISYECFGERCEIGKTSSGTLKSNFPQCVNGFVIVTSDGFKDAKYLYSTTQTGSLEIILDKLYEMDVKLKLDEKEYNKDAIISFISEDSSSDTIFYPIQKNIKLSEGQYEVQVYIYENSSLSLGETIKEQCMEVSRGGLGGLFGLTEKKCFDIKIPSQIISNVLVGGGKSSYYILESQLKNLNTIEINVKSLPVPKTIEQLQDNYELFETKTLEINFRS